jgi:uncharacterized lipoprotein YajG
MRRLLALALLCVALMLSGCDRPAAVHSPAPQSPARQDPARQSPAAVPKASDQADQTDVGSLLNDVDKQLNSADQTPADQD